MTDEKSSRSVVGPIASVRSPLTASGFPQTADITHRDQPLPRSAHKHRHLIDHLVSAQQERSERVVDDAKCIRASTEG